VRDAEAVVKVEAGGFKYAVLPELKGMAIDTAQRKK
jgi:hypothetical protein